MPEPITTKTALVFCANGISGTAMLDHLCSLPTSEVKSIIAVSRRAPQLSYTDPRLAFVSLDQLALSVNDMAAKLREVGGKEVTHAFHYAYIAKDDEAEAEAVNGELLRKAVEATVKVTEGGLKVFQLQTGYKYYGTHKGISDLAAYPFKESAPRHAGRNFYYIQEDLLTNLAKQRGYRPIITRPNVILGVSKGNFMNFAVTVGLYATVVKELGEPFVFPGNQIIWEAVEDHSTAVNNARFQWFVAGKDEAHGNIFNIHNGDKVRFAELWFKIASYFGLALPEPLFTIPNPAPGEIKNQLPLDQYMKDKDDLWEKISKKHNLDPTAFKYATWDFGNFVTGRTWGDEGDMTAARSVGWDVTIDTYQSYVEVFEKMKELKIIPK